MLDLNDNNNKKKNKRLSMLIDGTPANFHVPCGEQV